MNVKQMVLSAAAASLLAAAPAMASLGPHAVSGTGNHCKICHDTAQSSPTLRGWAGGLPAAPGDPEWSARTISTLCYMCHESGGGTVGGHDMTLNAYAGASHGNTIGSLPEGADEASQAALVTASGLPYTGATKTNLECTSCHNVHRQESRPAPFMQRDSVALLCEECHAGRSNSTPLRRFANTMAGARAYSTHPVNVAVNNTGNNNINIKAIAGTNVAVAIAAAPNYALGGHLVSGASGNMDCGTCHAVHGPTQDTPGVNDLLAVDNTTGAAGNALCETCHDGGIGSALAVGANNPSDHPIDNEPGGAFYPTTVAIPAAWTALGGRLDRGAQPFFGGTTPTCSSCHDTHGGLPLSPLLRYPESDASPNVFNYGQWCWECHTAAGISPDGHHSNTGNLATSQLICNDCHGASAGTTWTAHNGFWTFPVAISPTDSSFCEGCHTATNPRYLVTPAFPATKNKTLVNSDPGTFPATHGTLRIAAGATGDGGSHQVNIPANLTNTNVIAKGTAWAASSGSSEWGAGAINPICESCHNILVNGDGVAAADLTSGWEANLLLQPYEDDMPGVGAGEGANDFYTDSAQGAGATGDALCRGCHVGQGGNAADFVHNPAVHTQVSSTFAYTADTVPYGRTTLTVLATASPSQDQVGCPNKTTADAANAPNQTSYPAANVLNCDSCHRPHNANNTSLDGNRYLILEVSAANMQGTTICLECHNTDLQCQ